MLRLTTLVNTIYCKNGLQRRNVPGGFFLRGGVIRAAKGTFLRRIFPLRGGVIRAARGAFLRRIFPLRGGVIRAAKGTFLRRIFPRCRLLRHKRFRLQILLQPLAKTPALRGLCLAPGRPVRQHPAQNIFKPPAHAPRRHKSGFLRPGCRLQAHNIAFRLRLAVRPHKRKIHFRRGALHRAV